MVKVRNRSLSRKKFAFLLATVIFLQICPLTAFSSDTEPDLLILENEEEYQETPLDDDIGTTGLQVMALEEPKACLVPAYCTDDTCPCKEENDPDVCICEEDCLCRTIIVSPCLTPEQCSNDHCLCGTLGEEFCCCEPSCLCHYPKINFIIEATTLVNNATETSMLTGNTAPVTVNVVLSSSDVAFSDVVFKTYIKGPLEHMELDIDGLYQLVDVTEKDGYTIITVKSSISGAATGQYGFDVRFPPGVTINDTEAEIFTIVEGNIIILSDDKTFPPFRFGEEQGTKSEPVICTAIADTDWTLKVQSVELDYKDPNQAADNVFRLKIDLNRNPVGDLGVYYLDKEGTGLTITLPGEPGDTSILRLNTGLGGENIPYTLNGNVITIAPEHIPYNLGFMSGDPSYSNASSATLYLVFEIDYTKLPSPIKEGDFEIYPDLETTIIYDYTLADSSSRYKIATEDVTVVAYRPWQGGNGSISKSPAARFIEGRSFFSDGSGDEPVTPTSVVYTVRYSNNSATPVNDLVITDKLPTLWMLSTATSLIEVGGADEKQGVRSDAVYFDTITLTGFASSYITLGPAEVQIVPYIKGVPGTPTSLLLDTPVDLSDTGADELRVEIKGGAGLELRHGFSLSLQITVLGNPELAEPECIDERGKINYIRNSAEFEAYSTQEPKTRLSGGYSCDVHIYPFGNDDPEKVWFLAGAVSPSTSSTEFAKNITVSPGRDVYYRIRVTALDAQQHVYSPVFYLELPPEIIFNKDNPGDVTFSGSASGIDLIWEVIDNPVGAGQMLKIYSIDKHLLDPTQIGTIIIKTKIDGETPRGSTVTSRVYFGVLDVRTPLKEDYYKEGEYIKGGFSGEKLLLVDSVSVTVRGSGFLEGELWVQTELDRGTDVWHRHPEVVDALPGGLLTYKFVVRNGGDLPADEIVLYNVFSHESDHFIIGESDRASEWSPYLTGPVDLGSWAGHATVYYSEYTNHAVSTGGVYSGTDDWTTEPYNWQSVKAIKIVFDPAYTLNKQEEISLTVPMFAPVDYEFGKPGSKDFAVSSLATQFKFTGGNGRTTAIEPLKLTVRLTPNKLGEISGLVWGDLNGDGIFDAAEFVEPGVTVQLWLVGGAKALQDVQTDLDGKYKFTNLPDGEYELRVILPDGYMPGGAGADNMFLPDGENPAVYVTTTITIDTSSEDSAPPRVHTKVNAGIKPAPSSISGTVWRNLDGSGERDRTLSSNSVMCDEGMSDILVELYRMPGGGLPPVLMDSVKTGTDGSYSFGGLPAGRYYVVFASFSSMPANFWYADRVASPNNRWHDGMADFSQALPALGSNTSLIIGQSYEIWLASGQTAGGVDCGLTPERGAISGTVWRDTNGNGFKDDSEPAINGLTVTLTKTSGYLDLPGSYDLTAMTNTSGDYTFTNLTPGEYTVTYTDATGKEWVSYQAFRVEGTAIPEVERVNTAVFTGIGIVPELDKLDCTGYNIGLVQKLSISGKVFNDKNANGGWDVLSDEPLGALGITVTRTSGGDGTVLAPQLINNTPETGDYIIEGLWPGSYTVVFIPNCVQDTDGDGNNYDNYLVTTPDNGGFTRLSRTWTLVDLISGDNQFNKNLALTRPRTISGIVWHDRNGDTTVGTGEEALNRGLTLGGAASGTGASNGSAGEYLFDRLYPGVYTITVSLTDSPNYMITNASTTSTTIDGLVAAGVYRVTVPDLDEGSDKDPKDRNFGLARPVTMSGNIWQDKEMIPANNYVFDGIYDSSTDAYLGLASIARLERYNGSAWTAVETTSTNASGYYSFTGKLPGTYRVVLLPIAATYFITGPALTTAPYERNGEPDSASYSFDDATNTAIWDGITLYSEDSVPNLNLSLGKYATISGTFWHDLDGNGVIDDTDVKHTIPKDVILLRFDGTEYEDTGIKVTSNAATGEYGFSNIRPGEYKLVLNQGLWRVTNEDDNLEVDNTNIEVSSRHATWSVAYTNADVISYPNRDYLVSMFAAIEGGRVWIDKDANGLYDLLESINNNARVTLSYHSGPYTDWWAGYPHPKTVSVDEETGLYGFTELWPGIYRITLTMENENLSGYLRTNIDTRDSIDEISEWVWEVVIESGQTQGIDFGLVKPSSLAGDIWHDVNGDSVKDDTESGIGNVSLVRTGVTGVMRPYSKTISLHLSDGFQFINLYPGTYTLTSDLGAEYLRTYFDADDLSYSGSAGSSAAITPTGNNKIYTITITDGTGEGVVVTEAVAGYARQSSITGIIFNDINNNDIQDGIETAVTGATATLKRLKTTGDGYDEDFTAQTSGAGVFSFTQLLPGRYEVALNVPTGWMVTTPDGKKVSGTVSSHAEFTRPYTWIVNIPYDNESITLDTGYVQKSSISGYVWRDFDGNRAKNDSETFYSGLTVALYKGSGVTSGTPFATQTTDSNGAYLFDDLYPGDYTVVLTKPDEFWYVTIPGDNLMTNMPVISITLPDNTASSNNIFGLTQLVAITGVIFEDENVNGQKDIGEVLVPDVIALLELKSGGISEFTELLSNGDGTFNYANLAPGVYELSFSDIPPGWQIATDDGKTITVGSATAVFNRTAGVWTITVKSDAAVINIETGLVRKSAISGYVWMDHNNNQTKDPTESFYNGLTVTLYQDWNGTAGTVIKTATTGPNGEYEFTDLYLGDYTVVLTLPAANWFVTNTGSDLLVNLPEIDVELTGVAEATGQNFGITQLINISGRIWEDNDIPANGTYDATDTLVESATVTITGPDGFSDSATTGPDGIYEFNNLLLGAYTITFADEAYVDWFLSNTFTNITGSPSVSFTPAARQWVVESYTGYDRDDCNFALARYTIISGKVWEDVDGDGVYQNGEPLMGGRTVVISLNSGSGYAPVATLTTESDGTYSYNVTAPGLYRVAVTPPSTSWGFTNPISGQKDITISGLNETHTADFGLVTYVALSGLVWSELDGNGVYTSGGTGETPLSGHEVSIYRNGALVSPAGFATGTNGRFELDRLIPGDYEVIISPLAGSMVTISGAGFDPSTCKWTLTLQSRDSRDDLDCAFTPERTITGFIWYDTSADGIKDTSEVAMQNIPVKLLVLNGTEYVDVPKYPVPVLTNAGGEFSFTGLPPGIYRVVVDAADHIRTNPESPQTAEDRYLDYIFGVSDFVFTQHKTMGLVLPASLSGFTFLDKNSNGAYDLLIDAPCSVTVTIERVSPAPHAYPSFSTNSSTGKFDSFSALGIRLLPGEYKVTFGVVPDHNVSTPGSAAFNPSTRAYTITLAPDEDRDDLEVGYKAIYLITGYVWKDTNYNDRIDAGELHFTDGDMIEITIEADNIGFGPQTVIVDENGKFEVEVDGPDAYTVSVSNLPDGYWITSKSSFYDPDADIFSVAVSYDNRLAHLDIGAMLYVSVSGMLWMDDDADGVYQAGDVLIGDSEIQLLDADNNVIAVTRTDANGEYTFAKVPLGTYVVKLTEPPSLRSFYTGYKDDDAPDPSVSSFNMNTGVWTLVVGETGVTNANSGYCEPSAISGSVTNQSNGNNPVPGINVDLYKKNSTGDYELWLSDVTDASGAYVLDTLLTGEYKISITIPPGFLVAPGSEGTLSGNTVNIDVIITSLGAEWNGDTTIYTPSYPGDPPGGDPPGGGNPPGGNPPGGNPPGGDPPGGDPPGDGNPPFDSDPPADDHQDYDYPPNGNSQSPPTPNSPGNNLLPGENNTFIEADEFGIPSGEWRWDDYLGIWVYAEFMTEEDMALANLPRTGYPAMQMNIYIIMLILSLLCIILLSGAKSRLKHKKQ